MARNLLALAALGLLIYSLIDIARTPGHSVGVIPRWLWFVVVIVLPIVGPVLWLVLGKPRRSRPRSPGPDDDPEFLRRL